MDGFEGYVGIRMGEGQLINDLIFSLLFVLLFVFSLVFHANYHLFLKMVRDVFYVKERLSLFEEIDGNETIFRSFMIFQSLLLCSIALFFIGRLYNYIPDYKDIVVQIALFNSLNYDHNLIRDFNVFALLENVIFSKIIQSDREIIQLLNPLPAMYRKRRVRKL